MNSTQIHTLGTWISNRVFGKYRLCWSARRHGFSTYTFRNLCIGKADTITIFQSKGGVIYGGFTDVPWERPCEYILIDYTIFPCFS